MTTSGVRSITNMILNEETEADSEGWRLED